MPMRLKLSSSWQLLIENNMLFVDSCLMGMICFLQTVAY